MSKVIACCGRKAEKPYIIGSTGTKLYSVEELCCFIGRNLSVLEESDLNLGLVFFFRQELGLSERADYIEKLFSLSATPKDVLVAVLCSCDYFGVEEVAAILDEYDSYMSMSTAQRTKLKADRLMREGNIPEAVALYRSLLRGECEGTLSSVEYGEAMHNLAVAKIHRGAYSVAADGFLEAYRRTGSAESLKCYLFTLKLMKDEDKFSRERARLVDDRNLYSDINRTLDMVESEGALCSEMDTVDELKELKSSGKYIEYDRRLGQVLDELKKQYRSFA